MKKVIKKIAKIILIILGCLLCFVCLKIIRFQFNVVTDIKIQDGNLSLELPFEREDKINMSIPAVSNVFNINEVNELKDIKILINGNIVTSKQKFYEYRRRYYIPIGSIEEYNIVLTEDLISKLRGDLLDINKEKYIAINDVENILGCKSSWNQENKTIYIFNKEENVPKVENLETSKNSKVALIRLEDVSCSGRDSEAKKFDEFKIMIDMLKKNNIKFNVAWIPRYKDPESGVDNDLTKENTFVNCDFVSLLDYMINNGGEIGLHGYTHQSGDSTSGAGSELTFFDNTEESEVRNVAINAINTATYFNIKYKFFESPHYHATRSQQKILEEYFDVLFEPYARYWNLKPMISLSDKSTMYIPTVLGYVRDDNGDIMVERINNRWSDGAAALFFHPFKEFSYINIEEIQNGKIKFNYKEDSPLVNIIQALNDNNYTTIYSSELNDAITNIK